MPNEDRRPPTIDDIAAASGVSRSTVSRALGRPDLISKAVVERVRETAAQLGYSVNPVARALSTGKPGNLAVIVPDIANPFFPPIIRALQQRADDASYGMLIGDCDGDPGRELRLVGRLAPQIEGIVLVSSRLSAKEIDQLATLRPVVLINRDVSTLSRVLIDPREGLNQAVRSLAKDGHSRISYIAGPSISWSDQQRRLRVAEAGRRSGIEVEVIEGFGDSFNGGKAAVPTLLANECTGAIAFDDFVAHGVLAGLAEKGVSSPEAFSLIGFDDVLGSVTFPALSSIHAPGEEAGSAAMRMLLEQIAGGLPGQKETLATRFVPRATTAVPAAR